MAKTAEERLIDMRIAEARRRLAQLQAEIDAGGGGGGIGLGGVQVTPAGNLIVIYTGTAPALSIDSAGHLQLEA